MNGLGSHSEHDAPVLSIRGLEVSFRTEDGEITPIRGVDLDVMSGRVTALVGESGSGKSVTSLAVMGLLPKPAGRVSSGSIRYTAKDGTQADLAALKGQHMRSFRGSEIAMIFQEPMTSLNPVLTVGEQIAEQVRLHMNFGAADAWNRAQDMLGLVEIPDARRRANDYPHQMSGGMRQRVMIALAMSCNPRLLIADEPTTALDVTIQAQILSLIDRLRKEYGMGVLFITHNLGVVAEVADSVTVMYAGEVVESAGVPTLFKSPRHPYTRALIDCLPARATLEGGRRIVRSIPGSVASAAGASGCRFSPRCGISERTCDRIRPELVNISERHSSRCLKWEAMS